MTAASPAAVSSAQHEVIEVGAEDLPVFCPGPKAPLWSMHPRVFLDVARSGSARCAYCGAEYRLKPGTVLHGHH
ncbi:zinc-finger domain-containing protein [Achromobacter sp. Marseille-Q0513]|uniref:zinc-finger domain-containing protein n=1 Tax=Achromobacter sp. Marseille-Q0513 TaxID=2829161 RepID=UPI001B9E6716|nr:zinc-finger domain-containing protein [Achromobacter sp. Marseille-Q0513]MBR8653698.1 zinc-finger domain-containing protein [Achromobacter sp. Marseille-Q0513]